MRGRTASGAAGAVSNFGLVAVAVCALLVLSTWAGADSTARRQARDTHVGVAPADLVVLQFVGPVSDAQYSSSTQKFVRVHPDGTKDTTEFAVPSGHRLVITDVNWTQDYGIYQGNPSIYAARFWIENRASPTTRNVVHTAVSPYLNPGNSVVTGFSVGAGGRLLADINQSGDTSSSSFGLRGNPLSNAAALTSPSILLRGYLVREN